MNCEFEFPIVHMYYKNKGSTTKNIELRLFKNFILIDFC